MTAFKLDIDKRGVARLTLTRAERHNAFDDELIADLTRTLAQLAADTSLRALVLAADGKSFSAGADLNWMRRMADYDEAQNLDDARRLGALMSSLDRFPRPTLARIQGAAFGGGVGLISCCDIAVASDNARFCLSEVRLGIIPAVISPYVVQAIGARAARRYMQSAESFDAERARELGLVHEVVAAARLDETVEQIIAALLECGPAAQAAAKDLIHAVAGRPIEAALIEDTARRIAAVRASDEGREGLGAFLDKRSPAWIKDE